MTVYEIIQILAKYPPQTTYTLWLPDADGEDGRHLEIVPGSDDLADIDEDGERLCLYLTLREEGTAPSPKLED